MAKVKVESVLHTIRQHYSLCILTSECNYSFPLPTKTDVRKFLKVLRKQKEPITVKLTDKLRREYLESKYYSGYDDEKILKSEEVKL